jgi:hypothetical protein
MQTTKQPTGLRTTASPYATILQQVINKVTGFDQLYKEPEGLIMFPVEAEALLPIIHTSCTSGNNKTSRYPYNPLQCRCCRKDTMHRLMQFNYRGPPQRCIEVAVDLLYAII